MTFKITTSIVTDAINQKNGSGVETIKEPADSYDTRRLEDEIKIYLPGLPIIKVEKVYNKYLNAAFLLRKQQLELDGVSCSVKVLLHATSVGSVNSILSGNLDWRRVHRAKYGKGVSFSENADYANFHSSIALGHKAFIVCDVLIKYRKNGDFFQDIKCVPEPYDTFHSSNGFVYTKFDDYTFNPKFVIYYIQPERMQSRFYRHRRRRSYYY